ncbi:GFA family protein [Emcibacter nanhaiensis]|uniref:GFA family protein n=1 Tax=Emcibacter nanhaiensis TaxID=1505037 RepID=A0A501PC50_9PROT|nr:GFA family protein [Emcibacter nanhaiensis]TPD57661.1 GFA family protein [Emcibacter nanhaiensis]
MTEARHLARCLCGAIEIEASGPHRHVEYCHCKWCQRSSGSAFIPWITFPKEQVRVRRGELAFYHSSPEWKRGFCRDCGSTLSFHTPETFDLTLGVMDDPEPFRAERHIWTKSRISHVKLIDDLPEFAESPD